MNEHPIQNEPGWETEIGQKSRDFNNVITFHNIGTSIIHAIKKIPCGFESFKDIILSYFIKNIDKYYKIIDNNKKLEGKKIRSGIYSMTIDSCEYEYYRKELQLLYSKYDLLFSK